MIDWWIMDCLRLKRILPLDWYRPIHENPFLAPYQFHFFELDELDNNYNNSLLIEDENLSSMPINLIKSILKRFGGTVTDTIQPQTTHIITQFQCDHLLPTQLLGPVQFVTLTWILKILSSGNYFEPSEAIDFPCPIHPIPDSSSVVNYFTNTLFIY